MLWRRPFFVAPDISNWRLVVVCHNHAPAPAVPHKLFFVKNYRYFLAIFLYLDTGLLRQFTLFWSNYKNYYTYVLKEKSDALSTNYTLFFKTVLFIWICVFKISGAGRMNRSINWYHLVPLESSWAKIWKDWAVWKEVRATSNHRESKFPYLCSSAV